ncbi:DedA family protein [Pseudomonas rhizoryzae]|uniref:DedA family protein n=1 Tax=Pseudomonas rhizoryzae TaxID=2571129 RepID=UPI000735E296|nr:DedA family protein [Pseudomonas rhizoryzae]KTS94739.1 membrane protein [Pseudomonas psychrotolerans]KTT26052.1 membrane protein [Pseudomonas psychrotolerans]KTT50486.1 membrane protein [Pseudomonas psychrotolerans]KTT59648.1 membrane protein [Pseudomonas psychrotolerans]
MESLTQSLLGFIETHQAWAPLIVGLLAFGESLVLLGVFIPATALMLVVGGLAGSGVLAPIPLVLAAIIGAIVGDICSYLIGRWLGPGIVHRPPFRRYRKQVARTRLFFRRYGFFAVFGGRFLTMIRNTVPLVAGMMAMNQLRFQSANVLSAIVWAPLMMAPGYLAAKGIDRFSFAGNEPLWIGAGMVALLGAGGVLFFKQRLRRV